MPLPGNQTVMLVDADLRRQMVHKYLGYSAEMGLIDYLQNDQPLEQLITWPGIPKLTLISGKRTLTDSSEFLGSPKMQDLVAEMKVRYQDRYVIFDAPPVLSGADTIAFAPFVDSILMVVEAGKTSVQDVKKALELIPNEKFMGFVLNRQYEPRTAYGYYERA